MIIIVLNIIQYTRHVLKFGFQPQTFQLENFDEKCEKY